MRKRLGFPVTVICLLAVGYCLARWVANYVLENYASGPHVYIAQVFFAPSDLFLPVVSVDVKMATKSNVDGCGFEFSPKYLGPYRVGIAGVNNGDWYIPDSIQASLECDVSGQRRSYDVNTVSMYSGTSFSGKGAVLGILHAQDHSQIKCLVRLDDIEFEGVGRVSNYRVVVARMFVK